MTYSPTSNALPGSCYTCGGPADHSEAACQGDYFEEEEFPPEEFVDDRSHWQQYDEMLWNG